MATPEGDKLVLSTMFAAVHAELMNAQKNHDANLSEMRHQEDIECDLHHDLELNPHNAVEMVQIAKSLREVLRTRRYFKDRMLCYEPLIKFMQDQQNAKVIGRFSQLISELKKVEAYEAKRMYMPKVINGIDGKSVQDEKR